MVLDEAGHFFLKYRAAELAEIITDARCRAGCAPDQQTGCAGEDAREDAAATWWLHGVSRRRRVARSGPEPSMRRFLAVAAGQLVSITGSALTEFAMPHLDLHHDRLDCERFALFAVLGLVPGLLVTPLAGALVDRHDRRLDHAGRRHRGRRRPTRPRHPASGPDSCRSGTSTR